MWPHIPNWRQLSNISEHMVYVWGNYFFINTHSKRHNKWKEPPGRSDAERMYTAGSSSWWLHVLDHSLQEQDRGSMLLHPFEILVRTRSPAHLQTLSWSLPSLLPYFFLFSILYLKTEFQRWTYFMSILNISYFLIHNKNIVLFMYVKLVSGQVSMHIWLRAEQTATCF